MWEGLGSVAVGALLNGMGSPSPQTVQTGSNPFSSNTGLFNANWNGNNLNVGGNQSLQDMQGLMAQQALGQTGQVAPQGQMASNLGSQFLGSINQFDPQAIAQQQYGLLSPILQQQQQQQMLDLENRQFAQGRLGSTGGAQQMGQMQLNNNLANNSLMADSYNLGMQSQAQQANLGGYFSQMAPQLQDLYNRLPAGLLSQMFGIDNQGLALAQTAGNLGGATQTSNIGGYSPLQSIGQGFLSSGLNGVTQGVNGLFSGGGGTYVPGTGPSGRP